MIDRYEAPTGPEAMLRFGPDTGPVVVAALPLFEEANRTRAFVVTILRELAARGIAGALPDLPGQGESLVPTKAIRLASLREGHGAAVAQIGRGGRPVYALGVRSGALLDGASPCRGRLHFSPQDGSALLRDLERVRHLGEQDVTRPHRFAVHAALARKRPGRPTEPRPSSSRAWPEEVVEVAGNLVSRDLLTDLEMCEPVSRGPGDPPLRTVRLTRNVRPADRHVPGPPLWIRAEPGNDPALAALLAEDIATWVRKCEG